MGLQVILKCDVVNCENRHTVIQPTDEAIIRIKAKAFDLGWVNSSLVGWVCPECLKKLSEQIKD